MGGGGWSEEPSGGVRQRLMSYLDVYLARLEDDNKIFVALLEILGVVGPGPASGWKGRKMLQLLLH